MGDKAVKIDSEILKKVEMFIKKKENKIRYANKKQFIDIAVLEFLGRESNINSLRLDSQEVILEEVKKEAEKKHLVGII